MHKDPEKFKSIEKSKLTGNYCQLPNSPENKEQFIFRNQVNDKFRIVSRWLTKAMRFGTDKARPVDYTTLNYMLDWEPHTKISPEVLIQRAAMDGQKITSGPAYQIFKNLTKAGHLLKIRPRNKNGRMPKPQYYLYEKPFGWIENTTSYNQEVDNWDYNSKDADIEGKLTTSQNQEVDTGKTLTTSYNQEVVNSDVNSEYKNKILNGTTSQNQEVVPPINKERDITSRNAHKQNDKNGLVFIKTKREPGAGRNAPPAPASKKNKTEWIRDLIPPEKRKLIKFGMRRDIEKLFPDDEIEGLIKNAFSEGKNPPAYIQGAILRKRQSLTKPTSAEATPPNPKKNPANQYGIETKNGKSVGVLWNAFLGKTIKTDIEKFNEFLEYNTRDLSKIHEFVDYLRKEKAI